ncbi:ABC transporter substrate-binding protein [Candidatus Sumerlaeota bacterium]|nr:ABC transporter substrate-binding protein [Candidatus Sumerlaeota bacterium]
MASGCTKKKSEGVTEITFWHIWGAKYAQRAMNKIVEQYNQQNPGVKVVPLVVPFSETGAFIQKVLTAIAGGTPPDVLTFSGVPVLAGKNALLPLDGYIKRDNFDLHNFLRYRVKVASWGGHQYGIPFSTSANSLLFYNKDLFREVGLDPERPPRTWKELEETAKKLTIIKNGKIERLGFVPNWGQGWLYVWTWANGGEVLAEDNRTLLIDQPEGIEALEWMVRFADDICGGTKAIAAFGERFQGLEQGPLYTGKIAMLVTGSWDFRSIKLYAPDTDFGVALLPHSEKGKHITSCGGFSFCIPRGVRHPEEAWKFIKYITSKEIQLQWAKETDEMPTRPACWTDEYFTKDPKWQVAIEAMKNAHPFPEVPFGAELWQYLNIDAVQQALFHKKTPKQALVDAAKKCRKVIEKYYESTQK